MSLFIIKYWVEVIFSLILATIALLHKRLIKQIETQKAIQEGVCALLADALHRLFHEACKEVEKSSGVSVSTLDRVNAIYEKYKKLGGNGTGKEIYEQIHSMPLISRWGRSLTQTDPRLRSVSLADVEKERKDVQ